MKDPKQEREKLVDRAMNLWQIYAEDYRTRVIIYLFLLSWKRELKMTPLNPMRKRDLAEYPKNAFFSLLHESEAKSMLDGMTNSKIEKLIGDIEQMMETNYSYVTIGNKIIEYKYQIAHRGKKFNSGTIQAIRMVRLFPWHAEHTDLEKRGNAMNLEAKISGTHHFIFSGKDADLNAEEKLNQIMRYVVEKTVKTSSIERALQEQSQNVANLMAENTDLKAEIQTLQREIENERAKSTQYSHNLWSILDALGEQEAIVHFTKRL